MFLFLNSNCVDSAANEGREIAELSVFVLLDRGDVKPFFFFLSGTLFAGSC